MSALRLAVQNYTLRDAFQQDFDRTAGRLGQLGVSCVELAGLYDLPPEKVRATLDRYDIQVCGSHVGLDRLESDLQGVVEEAKTFGYHYVVIPWVGEEAYAQGWAALARRLHPVAESIAKTGLQLLYHNHDFELKRSASGTLGLDELFEEADPGLIQAEIDAGWLQTAGIDPAGYVRKWPGRVPMVHLKDLEDPGSRANYEPAHGKVNWPGFLAACDDIGTEFGIVEFDTCPRDPFESVAAAVAYFREQGLT